MLLATYLLTGIALIIRNKWWFTVNKDKTKEISSKILETIGYLSINDEEGIDLDIEFIPTFGLSSQMQIDSYLVRIEDTLNRKINQNVHAKLHKEIMQKLFIDAFLDNYSFSSKNFKISNDLTHVICTGYENSFNSALSKQNTFFDGVSKEDIMSYLISIYPGYIREIANKINMFITPTYLEELFKGIDNKDIYIETLLKNKELMNKMINENTDLYYNNVVYTSEINDMSQKDVLNIIEKKSKELNMEEYFKNLDTTRATGIITDETSFLFENFVAYDTNTTWTEHVRNAEAIYKGLYNEKLEDPNWMGEITRDGNILIQLICSSINAIWTPESVTSFQLNELSNFNQKIKEIYLKDTKYFNNYPMEFSVKIGDEEEMYYVNNIDEVIETLSNRL